MFHINFGPAAAFFGEACCNSGHLQRRKVNRLWHFSRAGEKSASFVGQSQFQIFTQVICSNFLIFFGIYVSFSSQLSVLGMLSMWTLKTISFADKMQCYLDGKPEDLVEFTENSMRKQTTHQTTHSSFFFDRAHYDCTIHKLGFLRVSSWS